jgi:hypothetical protein
MVKICQTGLLKLNFETRPKKRIFRFLPKISAGHGWSWKFFFANFQILGPLGCQGWVVIPQNVKKSQNHCTLQCPCSHVAGVGGQYKMYNRLIFINFISRSKKVKPKSKSCIKHLFTVNKLLRLWYFVSVLNLKFLDQLERRHCKDTPFFRPFYIKVQWFWIFFTFL